MSFDLLWDLGRTPLEEYASLHENQYVNRIPGLNHVITKAKLFGFLEGMASCHGAEVFSFAPQGFLLPRDLHFLETTFQEGDVVFPSLPFPSLFFSPFSFYFCSSYHTFLKKMLNLQKGSDLQAQYWIRRLWDLFAQ